MQQQQQQQPILTGALNSSNITTEHIQQYLDENKSLILKILDSQNSGKHGECAENQARLQRNLTYLAAIADSQHKPIPMYSTPGVNYMQQQQQTPQVVPQSIMTTRSPILYAQAYSGLQQQALHAQPGLTPVRTSAPGSGTAVIPDFSRSNTGDGLQVTSKAVEGASIQDIRSSISAGDQGHDSARKGGREGKSH